MAAMRSAAGGTADRVDEGDIGLSYPRVDGIRRHAMYRVGSLL